MNDILLYDYLYNKGQRIDNEFTQFINNMTYRNFDEIDCTEYIIAITRKKCFDEFSKEIYKIMKIGVD